MESLIPQKPLVLIVDDAESQRRLYELVAERIGVTAHIVQGCEDALAALDVTHFDLVLIDWILPDTDGLACQNLIRKRLSETGMVVPIICVTAKAMKGDREKCMDAGMDDYLAKPFTLDQLHEIVFRWLKPKQRRENIILPLAIDRQRPITD